MNVYDYLSLINTIDDVNVTIFDCHTEDVIFHNGANDENVLDAVTEAGWDYYEVVGVDLFKNAQGEMCIELNIDTEE